ncbi:MAG TPA: hypothetical protein VHT26_17370, partial [Trebonia sp.]|nr:hypothetical protein [Trebonia sp.]
AIMHKHDPVPPLPNDVPRPIADLVYAMLAKNAEDRPESARHVADRAEVIREARNRNGYSATGAFDLPVVPNFPPATSLDLYQGAPERRPVSRSAGNPTFLIGGIGAAAIGAVAIVVVLISSNGNSILRNGGNTTMPTQTQSQSQSTSHKTGAHTSVTQPAGNFVGGNSGNGAAVVGLPGTAASSLSATSSKAPSSSKSPSPSKSPTRTQSATATKSATAPKTPIQSTLPITTTTPKSSSPATTAPATSPPATTPAASSAASAGTG